MKAKEKRRTGNLKLVGLLTIALCMAAVTGCKKHEILEPNPRNQYAKGEDANQSASKKLNPHSSIRSDENPGANLRTSSGDNYPQDSKITDRNGSGDDGDDDGDGNSNPITDKDGNDGDDDGGNTHSTDEDGGNVDNNGDGGGKDGDCGGNDGGD